MKPGAMFYCLFLILLVLIPLITTQPCPCQNTYNNPTPLLLQPSNTHPYYQASTQIDPAALQETLNQLVFSKFLSNPSLKSIVDPNTKLLNQNGEPLRQGSNGNVPSVINNYFIVPPEFFNLNETSIKRTGKNNHKAKRKKNHKVQEELIKEGELKDGLKSKRGRRVKQQNLDTISVPNEEVVLITDENKPKKRKRIKSNNKKEKAAMRPQSDKLVDISKTIDEIPATKSKKLRRRKLKPILELESNDNLKPDISYQEILDIKPFISNLDNIETEKPKLRERTRRPKITEITDTGGKRLKNIEEPVDNAERHTDLTENRIIRDSKTNNKINKHSKEKNAPPFPDEIIKSFYPYLNQFYGNMPNYYEQFYSLPPYPRNTERNNRRKSNRNEKIKSNTINVKYKAETISQPKAIEKLNTEPNLDTSTEKSYQTEDLIELTTEIPEETPTIKEDIVSKENYEAWEDQIEDLQPYIVPELRENPPYNNFINDYYPIFYDQSLYSIENDDSLPSDESRYFYKTEAADLIRNRRKHDRYQRLKPRTFEDDAEFIPHIDREVLRNKFKDSSINLEGNMKILEKLNNIEQTKNVGENEPAFKTPPGLENPDFKTRNIKDLEEVKDFKPKDVEYDKLSVFSSSKTDILPEIKRIRIPAKNTRPKTENVETYYANSKVVKYGVPQESIESNESISVSNENDELVNGGRTTFVVAKSLGKIDDYYW